MNWIYTIAIFVIILLVYYLYTQNRLKQGFRGGWWDYPSYHQGWWDYPPYYHGWFGYPPYRGWGWRGYPPYRGWGWRRF